MYKCGFIRLFIARSTDNGKINFYYDRPIFLERSTSRSRSTGWRPLDYSVYLMKLLEIRKYTHK